MFPAEDRRHAVAAGVARGGHPAGRGLQALHQAPRSAGIEGGLVAHREEHGIEPERDLAQRVEPGPHGRGHAVIPVLVQDEADVHAS